MLRRIFGKKLTTEEMLRKTSIFLAGQINHLEKNYENYHGLIGKPGLTYIFIIAEEIANRRINQNELEALLVHFFGKEKVDAIIDRANITAYKEGFVESDAQIIAIAKEDVKSGMLIKSSNYLVMHVQRMKKAIDDSFNESMLPIN